MKDNEASMCEHRSPINRRWALKKISAAAAAILAAPYISRARAETTTIRALMWQPYVFPDIIAQFEKEHEVKFAPTFFDGNSEAYNKLRLGGTRDFDIVMADGNWPALYFREKLIREFDFTKLPNTKGYYPQFAPATYKRLIDAESGKHFGVPSAWGGLGIVYNAGHVTNELGGSLEVLFDPQFGGKLTASGRFEENIALAGMLVTHQMGTRNNPRPDGKPFNPYVLTDAELAAVEKLLIEQKKLLLTRYTDETQLEQLLAGGAAWLANEPGYVYRKLLQREEQGELSDDFRYTLRPKEGAIGWIDAWMVTSGVEDANKLDLCLSFINLQISPAVHYRLAKEVGASPTTDVRSLASPAERAMYFMDRAAETEDMYMIDQPYSVEKWERVWSNVQAS